MINYYNISAMKLNQFAFLRAFGRGFSSQIEPPTECFFNSMKDIPGYGGRYAVTEDGRIFSHKKKNSKGGFLKTWLTGGGYEGIHLSKLCQSKVFLVHRLVAMTYIPNPDNKPQVNHKNGIRNDNRMENLEWCTVSENGLHSYRENGRIHPMCRKVGMFSKEGIKIKDFPTIRQACKEMNLSEGNVSSCCRGRKHHGTSGGFIWKYL